MHDDQLDVDVSDVARMVAAQFPEWADADIERVPSTGTVNHLFRLGTRLVARLPMQGADPHVVLAQLRAEHAAMTAFNAVSTVPAPAPMAIGEPGHGYPLPWSVQTWRACGQGGSACADCHPHTRRSCHTRTSSPATYSYATGPSSASSTPVDTGLPILHLIWSQGGICSTPSDAASCTGCSTHPRSTCDTGPRHTPLIAVAAASYANGPTAEAL